MKHSTSFAIVTLLTSWGLTVNTAWAAEFMTIPLLEPSDSLIQRPFVDGLSDDGSTVLVRQLWNRDDGSFEFVQGVWGHWPIGEDAVTTFGTPAEFPQYLVRDVSGNGQVFVGIDQTGFDDVRAVRLGRDGSAEVIDPPSGWVASGGSFISRDGTKIVGYGLRQRREDEPWLAGYWDEDREFTPYVDLLERTRVAISANAEVAVGHLPPSWPEADKVGLPYRWTESNGVELLPLESPDDLYRVDGLSGEGRWTVGRAVDEDALRKAFAWDGVSAAQRLLPPVEGWGANAYDITDDGSRILGLLCPDGTCADRDLWEPALWSEATGFVPLEDILARDPGLGEVLDGWDLRIARHMSADGRYISGVGINPQGQEQAWLADLGASVPEPGGMSLLIMGLLPLLGRCRDVRQRSDCGYRPKVMTRHCNDMFAT